MAFRGYFALNGSELANSSRVVSHLGQTVPASDIGIFPQQRGPDLFVETPPGSGHFIPSPLVQDGSSGLYTGVDDVDWYQVNDGLYLTRDILEPCGLVSAGTGLFRVPATSDPVGNFYTPPDGARRYGQGLLEVSGACWDSQTTCGGCRNVIGYDDSWPGLRDYLNDTVYRPELAPWYSTRLPQSSEFSGVWMMDVKGLDTTPVQREVTESAGSGGSAGPHRDKTRTVVFDAMLLACSNAGLQYGLQWLTCRLRETNDSIDSVLQYFTAHPFGTGADPTTMVREAHGVVLTQEPQITQALRSGDNDHNRQATMYRVSWQMVITTAYVYAPPVDIAAIWDEVALTPINWVHAADCTLPEGCEPMPVLFSADCEPETVEVVSAPPPSCGGCLPVCGVEQYLFRVPTLDYPLQCQDTAVTLTFTNLALEPLTVQSYWRRCGTDIRCEDNLFPVQLSGLPAGASITLDSVTGRYYARADGRVRRPVGIVNTPNGAPWRPTVINRADCYEFVVLAPSGVDFDVDIRLTDREP